MLKFDIDNLNEISLEDQKNIVGGFWRELLVAGAVLSPGGLVVLSNLVFAAGVSDGYNAA